MLFLFVLEFHNEIKVLQNRVLRKETFKKLNDAAHTIYCKLHILKFNDMIYLQKCLFMLQIEQNQKLASFFPGLKLFGDKHNYQICNKKKVNKNNHSFSLSI